MPLIKTLCQLEESLIIRIKDEVRSVEIHLRAFTYAILGLLTEYFSVHIHTCIHSVCL